MSPSQLADLIEACSISCSGSGERTRRRSPLSRDESGLRKRFAACPGLGRNRRARLSPDSPTGSAPAFSRSQAFVAVAPSAPPSRRQRSCAKLQAHAGRRKSRPSSLAKARLKEMARETMRPSTSGSTTFMARSAAERPRLRVAPLLAPATGKNHLQHGRVRLVQHAAAAVEPSRKGGGVEDHVGLFRRHLLSEQRAGGNVFQAGGVKAQHAKIFARQRRRQGRDRRAISCKKSAAIEQDEGAWPRPFPRAGSPA